MHASLLGPFTQGKPAGSDEKSKEKADGEENEAKKEKASKSE